MENITFSSRGYQAYVNGVRDHVPQDFEQDSTDEGLSPHIAAYIFACFMDGLTAESCARRLANKLTEPDEENKE